jgi:pyruvate-formate lyase-activating enzyme
MKIDATSIAIIKHLREGRKAYKEIADANFNVVLGGFGDPLLHPQFAQILGDLRRAGVYGVAVRTTGLALDNAAIAALMEHRVDLVTVLLDAWSPSLYRRLHGGELQPLADAIERLEKTRLEQRRQSQQEIAFAFTQELPIATILREVDISRIPDAESFGFVPQLHREQVIT